MQPLLDRDEAGAIKACAPALHEGGGLGRLAFGVFGAVFIAREVPAVARRALAVAKGLDHAVQVKGRGQRFFKPPRQQHQITLITAAQPQAQGGRRGGHLNAGTRERRELAQAGDCRAQGRDQPGAECRHHGLAIHQRGEALQALAQGRRLRGSGRCDGEKSVTPDGGHGLQDAGLKELHRFLFSA